MSCINATDYNQHKQTVLITGAASGIGYELARIFARDAYNLILVDKNRQKISEVAVKFQEEYRIFVKYIVKDLAIKTAPEEIFTDLQSASIKVDILVNNAGFGSHGLFNEMNLANELEMLQVNLVCLTHLTQLFLKDMVKQGNGKVLNVASTAAFQPGPLMAVYFATKAYILSFSEAIANELEATGVTVTVLCPGPTESAFHQRTGVAGAEVSKKQKMMDAETVAKIGYYGLMTNKTVVIPGFRNKLLVALVRFVPRKLVTKIVRNMNNISSQSGDSSQSRKQFVK